mmetsp:Transcript_125576/g.246079  ORF Transcript_125576/g.246079 Transcript_125576/m.246079 type:complete len:233 (-) Transcript_125576:679-1377(-)
MLWLMDTTAAPSGRVPGLRRSSYNSRAPSFPMALVASSKKSTSGRRSTAWAIAKRCRSPPDRAISQFASSDKLRPAKALSKATADNACRTSTSEKLSSHSGYVSACFKVPCGMCECCGTKRAPSPGKYTVPLESGHMPASARKKQLFPEPSGAVNSTNSPRRTVKPAPCQIARPPALAGSRTQMSWATTAASGSCGAGCCNRLTSETVLWRAISLWKFSNLSAVARKSVKVV